MSPLQIEILMHYFTRPGDYRDGDLSAPAVQDSVSMFVSHGILNDRGLHATPRYEGTEALQVYITALRSVPLPVQRWVMPDRP